MMRYVVILTLLIIALLITGCTVNYPVNMTTDTLVPPAGPSPTGMAVPVTLSSAIDTPAVATNITGTGNRTIIHPADDLFFLMPVKARYYEGDVVTVHGTTILAEGDPLLVEVVSTSFGPTAKTNRQFFTGVSGVVHVRQGSPGGPNKWSFSFPTDGFVWDTYTVTVSGLTVNVKDSTTFELLPRMT